MPGLVIERPTFAGAIERRDVALSEIELRADSDKLIFQGHAAIFDRLSEDLGGFRERIQRGAFRKVLDRNPDVRLLFNHNPDHVLARTTNGSLELREDPKGLRVYAELAQTTLAKDLRVLIQRGDVSGMSFGFRVDTDVWNEEDDGELIRTIVSFSDLFDVGPVTFPAYVQTDASMRSRVLGTEIVSARGQVIESALRDLAWRIHRGEVAASPDDRRAIDAAFERIESVSPWIAEQALRAVSQEPELQAAIHGKRASVSLLDVPTEGGPAFRLAARRRRLSLIDSRGEA